MEMRLIIRGFGTGWKLQFEDRTSVDSDDMAGVLPALAEKHAKAMAAHQLQMIEIEFLDEPDPQERFFRFGTDARMMRDPTEVPLDETGKHERRIRKRRKDNAV